MARHAQPRTKNSAGPAKTATLNHLPLQTKMEVGASTDRFESEADRVADHTMRSDANSAPPPMLSSLFGGSVAPAQRKAAAGFPEGKKKKEEDPKEKASAPSVQRKSKGGKQGKAKEEEKKPKASKAKTGTAQRKAAGGSPAKNDEEKKKKPPKTKNTAQRDAVGGDAGFNVPAATETAINQARSTGGQSLAPSTRSFMENRIGHDFSGVKVHNNAAAHGLASDLNAKAFTIGNDVFFGQGHYKPGSQSGRKLLAHELAHTVQQNGGTHSVQAKRIQRTAPANLPELTREDKIFDGGTLGKIDLNGQENQRLGEVILPKIELPKVGSVFKGGNEGELTGAPNPGTGTTAINPDGQGQFSFEGGQRTHGGARTWDAGSSRFAVGVSATNLSTKMNPLLSNDNSFSAGNEPYYYLTLKGRQTVSSPRRIEQPIFMGTASQLAQNRELLRPQWDADGNANAMDVDHFHEIAIGGADSFENFILLDAQANSASGRYITRKIDRDLQALVNAANQANPNFWDNVGSRLNVSRPSRMRQIRERYNVKFLSYDDIEVAGNENVYWTQAAITRGDQLDGLRPLTNRELTIAGIRPADGQTPTSIRLITGIGGGRKSFIYNKRGVEWRQANAGRRNFGIRGFRGTSLSYEYSPQKAVGEETGNISGNLFRNLKDENGGPITIPGPTDQPFPLIKADPFGAVVYIDRGSIRSAINGISIAGASPITVTDAGISPEGEVFATGEILPTKNIFKDINIPIQIIGDRIFIQFPLNAEGLDFGPITVTQAALEIGYDDGFYIGGSAGIAIDQLGTGNIYGILGEDGAKIGGDFNFDIDFLDPATAGFEYDMGTDALTVNLTAGVRDGVIPGIESGEVTAQISRSPENEAGTVDLNGTLSPKGFLSGAEITLAYNQENGITIELNNYRPPVANIPAIKNAVVSLGVNKPAGEDDWNFYGRGTAEFDIPNVTGGMTLAVHNDLVSFTGEGRVEYGPAVGTLNVNVTNQKMDDAGAPIEGEVDDALHAGGRGTVSLTFGIITATAGITYSETDGISVDGELALPPTYELFEAEEFNRELFRSPRVTFPIWGVSLAGYTLGIAGFVDARLNFLSSIGPGTVNDANLRAEYAFDRPEETVITGGANLNLPAYAGLKLDVGGGLIAGAGIAEISGRLGLTAELGIQANAGADLSLRWTPTEGLSFTAEAYANVSPKFSIGITASVTASIGVSLLSVSHTWGPWEETFGEFGPNLMIEARMPMGWSERDGLDFDFDNATLTYPEIDFQDIATDAFLELV